jgi:hypothetical protein
VGRGLRPNATAGRFLIRVSTSYRGQTASATIAQINAILAGATKGGGKKFLIIALISGAAAGGPAAAMGGKSGSSSGGACRRSRTRPARWPVRHPSSRFVKRTGLLA